MKKQLWDMYFSARGWMLVSKSCGRDTGSGTRGQHGQGPCAPKGQCAQHKLVCALCRGTQLQAKLAGETGQRISTQVR